MAYKTKIPRGTEDTDHIRCKQCGFMCDITRDNLGPGDGIKIVEQTISGETVHNPTVLTGCPLCGSKNWK